MARRSSKARRRPKARPQGVLELHAQGFGFVKTAEGEYFIPASKVNGCLLYTSRHLLCMPRLLKQDICQLMN